MDDSRGEDDFPLPAIPRDEQLAAARPAPSEPPAKPATEPSLSASEVISAARREILEPIEYDDFPLPDVDRDAQLSVSRTAPAAVDALPPIELPAATDDREVEFPIAAAQDKLAEPIDLDEFPLPLLPRDEQVVSYGGETVPEFDDAPRDEPLVADRIQLPPRPKAAGPSVIRTIAEIPVLLIVAAVIAFLVKSLVAQAFYIPSGSMIPQLQINDRVVVSKLAYKTHEPRRGDIIVFDDPRSGAAATSTIKRTGTDDFIHKVGEAVGVVQPSTDEFIKRVIGLPGETVEGRNGHVYVNGHLLIEPYLNAAVYTSDFAPQLVKPGRLWVMGDNRTGSADSRVFGQVKRATVVGRAVVKVWPFPHISFL